MRVHFVHGQADVNHALAWEAVEVVKNLASSKFLKRVIQQGYPTFEEALNKFTHLCIRSTDNLRARSASLRKRKSADP